MHKMSMQKIMKAGLIFYRDRWDETTKSGSIWYATTSGSWRLHSERCQYRTKSALKKAMDDLRENDPTAITEH